ncbi:hypothetical protein G9A89_013842 [Geosiphon pyriformis]|nr:hypothetical protein G9A89_013842 [Geosiphon pyriformis]
MADTHIYQPHVAISRPPTRQPHLLNLRKRRRNLPGKSTKFPGPTPNTMSCCQYLHETTTVKESRRQAIKCLDGCPHDDDKIWQIALAKIKGVTPEEIKTIKNNPPEPIKLNWDPKPIINLLDPEQFHENYQELAPMKEEQKQCLEEINTQLYNHCLILCDF